VLQRLWRLRSHQFKMCAVLTKLSLPQHGCSTPSDVFARAMKTALALIAIAVAGVTNPPVYGLSDTVAPTAGMCNTLGECAALPLT